MKKIIAIFMATLLTCLAFAQQTVQVVMPEGVNLSGSEAMWLPGQIQDKIKSNLQEYLGMRTVVDSASESKLKQLQRESEGSGRDENTAIELGKISTAKFAVFTRIRRTGNGYTISADYTDLTTGVQRATATSKEYKSAEELYGSTGAIDEVTLMLSEKLGIAINPVQKQALQYGTADFSIDDQLKLARQNEEQYKKLMSQFDEQLRTLSLSSDLSAVENTKKIEAEKALLVQKQESEQRRLAELAEQKKQAAEDALKEAARSEEQKKKRDALSAQAIAKAAEVRKLKMEKQGVFGQISIIESKKKALWEIRQSLEAWIQELREQAKKDKAEEASKIRGREWASVELENGSPTKAAKQRRENQIAEYNRQRDESLQKEIYLVGSNSAKQDAELLAEIRYDQERISTFRTISSMGDEVKVSYGAYSGQNNGWKVYLSLYSEGTLLYQNSFLLDYKALTGKTAPDVAKASDAAVQDYADTVDMYNSLLLRGDPILYFEIDYKVTAAPDDEPSKYTFYFSNIRVMDTVTGKTAQTILLAKTLSHVMSPAWDTRGILAPVAEQRGNAGVGVPKAPAYLILDGTKITGCNKAKLPADLVIPDGVTEIWNVFAGCTSLRSVTIPASVTKIWFNAFKDCKNIKTIQYKGTLAQWCQIYIGDSDFVKNAKTITLSDVTNLKTLTALTIPDGVTKIEYGVFEGCTSLRSVRYTGTFAQWCQLSVGEFFFSKTITLSDVSDLRVLTEIAIPWNVTKIGEKTFFGCKSLTSVTIPASVTEIEWGAFWNCESLKNVYYAGSQKQWKKIKIDNRQKTNAPLLKAKIHYDYNGK